MRYVSLNLAMTTILDVWYKYILSFNFRRVKYAVRNIKTHPKTSLKSTWWINFTSNECGKLIYASNQKILIQFQNVSCCLLYGHMTPVDMVTIVWMNCSTGFSHCDYDFYGNSINSFMNGVLNWDFRLCFLCTEIVWQL